MLTNNLLNSTFTVYIYSQIYAQKKLKKKKKKKCHLVQILFGALRIGLHDKHHTVLFTTYYSLIH